MNDTTWLAAASSLEIIQFLYHVNSRSILQLTNGISNDLKKLLTYFKGTTNFTLLTLLLSVTLISLICTPNLLYYGQLLHYYLVVHLF